MAWSECTAHQFWHFLVVQFSWRVLGQRNDAVKVQRYSNSRLCDPEHKILSDGGWCYLWGTCTHGTSDIRNF